MKRINRILHLRNKINGDILSAFIAVFSFKTVFIQRGGIPYHRFTPLILFRNNGMSPLFTYIFPKNLVK